MNGYKLLKSEAILRYWPVYNGDSIMIDNNGNQSLIQDWDSLEGFGYDIYDDDKQDYVTKFVHKQKLTEWQYHSLISNYNPEQ